MSKSKWGTTWKPGEFEALQRELWPNKPPVPLQTAQNAIAPTRSKLFTLHSCPVKYPDGVSGNCEYERNGPSMHVFRFRYDLDSSERCHLYHSRHLENTRDAVEAQAQELTTQAYARFIQQERQYYFARASESEGRKARKWLWQTNAKTAKEWGGKYAICYPAGTVLRPYQGVVYDTLEEANTLWETTYFIDAFGKDGKNGSAKELGFVVACFNRLDRCWELPRFNTLYAEHDLRSQFAAYMPERDKTIEEK